MKAISNRPSLNNLGRALALSKAGNDNAKRANTAMELVADFIPRRVLKQDSEVTGYRYSFHRHLSDFAATELFFERFREWSQWYARELDLKVVGVTPSSLIFCGPRLVSAVWQARQYADQLGMDYEFFVIKTFQRLRAKAVMRSPSPLDLLDAEVLQYAIDCWNDPEVRAAHNFPKVYDEVLEPLFPMTDDVKLAITETVVSHVRSMVGLGYSASKALSRFVGASILEPDARKHFGDEVVGKALAIIEAERAELATALNI